MPLFEYACSACGRGFEELVREGVEVRCPDCGSTEVEKCFSTFSAHAGGDASVPPPCRHDGPGCDLGKCGSGRCGLA